MLNRPLSDLERWNDNRTRTGKALFLSFNWFLSRDGLVDYQVINQNSICLWNDSNDDTKRHWDARAARLNLQPVPGLLSEWPEDDLPYASIKKIVLQSLKKEHNYLAGRM